MHFGRKRADIFTGIGTVVPEFSVPVCFQNEARNDERLWKPTFSARLLMCGLGKSCGNYEVNTSIKSIIKSPLNMFTGILSSPA